MPTREQTMEAMLGMYKEQLSNAHMQICELQAIISLHNTEFHSQTNEEGSEETPISESNSSE